MVEEAGGAEAPLGPHRKPTRAEHGPPKTKSEFAPGSTAHAAKSRAALGAGVSARHPPPFLLTSRGRGCLNSTRQRRPERGPGAGRLLQQLSRRGQSSPALGAVSRPGWGWSAGRRRRRRRREGRFCPARALLAGSRGCSRAATRRKKAERRGRGPTLPDGRGWRSATRGSPPSRTLARAQSGGHADGGGGSPLGGGEGRQSDLPQGATRGGGGGPGLLAALRRVRGGGGG